MTPKDSDSVPETPFCQHPGTFIVVTRSARCCRTFRSILLRWLYSTCIVGYLGNVNVIPLDPYLLLLYGRSTWHLLPIAD